MASPMFCMKLETLPGAEIGSACRYAQRVSDLLNVACEFTHNSVSLTAYPGGDAQELAERWRVHTLVKEALS